MNWAIGLLCCRDGEDAYFNDERMCEIIRSIKKEYPDCAVTLSLGERSEESYRAMHKAGVRPLSSAGRDIRSGALCDAASKADELGKSDCTALKLLKETGYQTGCGFMVGFTGLAIRISGTGNCVISKN